MAFNLPKVLRALLFASNGPLTIKEIQETLTRFHQQEADLLARAKTEAPAAAAQASAGPETEPPAEVPAHGETPATDNATALPADPGAEVAAVPPSADSEPELYQEVPSLVTATQIREAMDVIAADLRARDEVFFLIEGSAGYRLVTNPKTARWVRLLRDEPPPVRLSQAALETLAVIAYRQPVTRGEIETIRGVSAEAGLNKLLERGLVYVAGRAELPGRPIQYGTTDDFLEFVGIKSLAEMPASDVLSNRQIDEWLKQAEAPQMVGDKEVGLQTEELPLDPAEEPVEDVPVTDPPPPPAAPPAPGAVDTLPPQAGPRPED